VRDRTTSNLMVEFHRRYSQNVPTAIALQQSMREIAVDHPHPYFWAPFVAHSLGRSAGASSKK